MKKQWKKLCTLALAAVLTASMVPMMAMGEEQVGWTDQRGTFDTEELYGKWSQNTVHTPTTDNAHVQDPEDEKNYVLKTGKKDYVYSWANLSAGRYKITLRYRGEAGTAPYVALRTAGSLGGEGFRGTLADVVSQANKWENYTGYFTLTEDFMSKCSGGPFLYLGDVNCTNEGYYDDVLITTDTENSISYVCTEDFSNNIGNTAWPTYKTSAYRGTPVEKISAATVGDAGYAITAVGHYIPTTQNEEKFNLISCVYQVNQETNEKQLAQVQITPGTATGGVAATVSANVTVQEKTDEYTYEVKSFLWSEFTALQSLVEASTLSY